MRSIVVSGIVALGLLGATIVALTLNQAPPPAPVAAAPTAVPSATPAPTAVPSPTPAPSVVPSATPVPTLVPAPIAAPPDGKTLFQRKGCIGCHSVSAAGLKSEVNAGPELSALAQIAPLRRPGLTADAYIRESIRLPQAFRVPGFSPGSVEMPTLPVDDAELDALVTFLLSDHR
ncbi:MAG TPA: c-type cytochrome [Chloroflexota bacterium]